MVLVNRMQKWALRYDDMRKSPSYIYTRMGSLNKEKVMLAPKTPENAYAPFMPM